MQNSSNWLKGNEGSGNRKKDQKVARLYPESMPAFTDSLRGYAFKTMQRDGFRCCYCGLDGRNSFQNWLQLTEEHLLPKGHPSRNDPDYIVCACNFCNTADNRYFDLLAKRGLALEGLSPEQLIAQRRPFVEATRAAYNDFWTSEVKGSAPRPLISASIEERKSHFVQAVAKVATDEQAARNAIIAAFQHNPTYVSSNTDGSKFRLVLSIQIRSYLPRYNEAVSDEEHCQVIKQISDSMSNEFQSILRDGRLRIGTVQKALNLYLKTAWCMGLISTAPPHCPVDGIILRKALDYLKGNAQRLVGSSKINESDIQLSVVELMNVGAPKKMTSAGLVAFSSALTGKPVQSQMVVLGDMSLGGTVEKVDGLAETLQLALDAGARKVLLPMTNAADIATVPPELFTKFQTSFYSDPVDAVYKALGLS